MAAAALLERLLLCNPRPPPIAGLFFISCSLSRERAREALDAREEGPGGRDGESEEGSGDAPGGNLPLGPSTEAVRKILDALDAL